MSRQFNSLLRLNRSTNKESAVYSQSATMSRKKRYYENNHDALKNHAINSVRAIKAEKITSRLNFRIRLS
jgi:hypothetical protein